MANIPLYNSIIIKTYLEYLENRYPDLELRPLLEYAQIASHEVEDKGHWLTQEQVNRFQEHLERLTGNPNIAREAGRYIISAKSSNILRQITIGFLNPAIAYWAVEKLASTLTRHLVLRRNKLSDNEIEIIVTPRADVKEEPFQCENRIGMLEAVAEAFTNKYARIEHPECMHRGDSCCHYIITWETPRSHSWKRTGYKLLALSTLVSLPLLYFLPMNHWLIFFLSSILISVGMLLHGNILHNKEMSELLEGQGKASDEVIEQINLRYNESLLVREIGEAASSILEPQNLLNFIIDALQKRLQFNRGMIMLANLEKTKLVYTTGYGYTAREEELLKNTDFNLTNPESKGIFYLAFRDQRPFLIEDANSIEKEVSSKSYNFIKGLGITAFICVPIVYEGKSEGILAVDNTRTKSKPTQSDLSLLMGIAPQIGISLNNALAHKRIKESEERFRNLSDNSPDIIYQLDKEGRFKYLNPAWEEVFGHNKDDLRGRYLTDFLSEDDRVTFSHIFQKIVTDKSTIRDKNFIILNKKGLPRYITFTGAPDLDAERKVVGVVGTLKDITKLRSMEAQLQQASKMEAMGTLTSGIAHDFNNIIQAIMGYNQLMISGRAGNETDMIYLNNIGELIQRSRQLVQQLMLFSKKVEPQSKVVNINDEIKSMQNLLIKSIPKMIDIKTDLDENAFLINADSTQIGQIIMNLVINARDALGDSGTITITTRNISLAEDKPIAGSDIPAGNYIDLSVADTGCGMAKEVRQRIFEPFFTTKGASKGTGLGLAVVHGIVKNHEGFIFCESEPGKGTTFRILFTASTGDKPIQKVDDQPQQLAFGTETILFVDDEKSILEIARETLRMHGYNVKTAQNGEEALKIYNSGRDNIELVVLDLIMPGMGGKKCLNDLVAINPRVKVLMTSGYSSSQQIEELTQSGAYGFINKPYRPEDLLLTIRGIIDAPVISR